MALKCGSGKRLLILGGLRYQIPVIKKAQELGCYVISADIYPDNIAHQYSDEYHFLNIVNQEEVCEAARSLRVDGIMSFAVDPGVVSAAYACEKLDLPNVGPYESVKTLQNKELFRSFLLKNDFVTPNHGCYRNYYELLTDLPSFTFPVFVKPVDSAGSKGVTKVLRKEDLEEAFNYAMSKSICGKAIVEESIDFIEQPSDSDCFSLRGDLVFFSMSNQYYDAKATNPFTPAAYIWPSTVQTPYQDRIKQEIQRLFSILQMDTSVYNIEARLDKDGKVYIMECSPRGGGNRISEILGIQRGIDIVKNSVFGALGIYEAIDFAEHRSSYSYWGEIVLHSNVIGTFERLSIDGSVRERIHEIDLWVSPGDEVGDFSGANAAIGTIILKAKSRSALEHIIQRKDELVQVIVKASRKHLDFHD